MKKMLKELQIMRTKLDEMGDRIAVLTFRTKAMVNYYKKLTLELKKEGLIK